MNPPQFSIVRAAGRWCVRADGEELATAETAHGAYRTAISAVAVLRRSGIKAELTGAWGLGELRSFAPSAASDDDQSRR